MAKASKKPTKKTTIAVALDVPVDNGLIGGRPDDRRPTVITTAKSAKKKP